MSYGIPGYDFDTYEEVNDRTLRDWLEKALWQDLSFSETSGEIIGIHVASTAPAASEGSLWWDPATQRMQVYTRRGWCGLFLPWSWETRRLRYAQTLNAGTDVNKRRCLWPYTNGIGGNPSVTAQTVGMYAGDAYSWFGAAIDCFPGEATASTDTFYPMVGWGVVAHRSMGFAQPGYLQLLNSTGHIQTARTDTSLAVSALDTNALSVCLAGSLAPNVADTALHFFFGGAKMNIFREDGA